MSQDIQIRIATQKDAKELLQIYAPYVEHTAITFEYTVPTEEEFANRISHTLERYPYLVALQEGVIVGYAYVSPFKARAAYDWCVETSIYVSQEKKGLGIGKLLLERLESVCGRMGILNMNACIACPIGEDPYLTMDSIHFHDKMGYTKVAHFHTCGYKFNRWYDMVWMEKCTGEHTNLQREVKPFCIDMLLER